MLDIEDLEKKWAKYHFKKVFPYYLGSSILTIALGISYYVYIHDPDIIKTLFQEKEVPKLQETIVEATIVNEPAMPPVEMPVKTASKNVLIPSFNFIYNLEEYVITYNNAQKLEAETKQELAKVEEKIIPPKPKKEQKRVSKPAVKPKPVAKTVPKTPVKTAAKVSTPKITPPKVAKAAEIVPVQNIVVAENSTPPEQESPQALIKVTSASTSDDEIRSVIKRFDKNKNPALSLFISKQYYENGNYKESFKYAKETYALNPNIEDGVLLYAQSSAKLGKKDEAISKLEIYIKRSGSINAKSLLHEIQKGTFK